MYSVEDITNKIISEMKNKNIEVVDFGLKLYEKGRLMDCYTNITSHNPLIHYLSTRKELYCIYSKKYKLEKRQRKAKEDLPLRLTCKTFSRVIRIEPVLQEKHICDACEFTPQDAKIIIEITVRSNENIDDLKAPTMEAVQNVNKKYNMKIIRCNLKKLIIERNESDGYSSVCSGEKS